MENVIIVNSVRYENQGFTKIFMLSCNVKGELFKSGKLRSIMDKFDVMRVYFEYGIFVCEIPTDRYNLFIEELELYSINTIV